MSEVRPRSPWTPSCRRTPSTNPKSDFGLPGDFRNVCDSNEIDGNKNDVNADIARFGRRSAIFNVVNVCSFVKGLEAAGAVAAGHASLAAAQLAATTASEVAALVPGWASVSANREPSLSSRSPSPQVSQESSYLDGEEAGTRAKAPCEIIEHLFVLLELRTHLPGNVLRHMIRRRVLNVGRLNDLGRIVNERNSTWPQHHNRHNGEADECTDRNVAPPMQFGAVTNGEPPKNTQQCAADAE
jgi:hypothetical protein